MLAAAMAVGAIAATGEDVPFVHRQIPDVSRAFRRKAEERVCPGFANRVASQGATSRPNRRERA
jgi:hypothetical protein